VNYPVATSKERTPDAIGILIVAAAVDHGQGLREKATALPDIKESDWDRALQELFRAHYCLAVLGMIKGLPSSETRELYASLVLEYLQQFPVEEAALVRETFLDRQQLDAAVGWYVHRKLTSAEREALNAMERRILAATEEEGGEKGLAFFCASVHLRVARLLGIVESSDRSFITLWLQNVGAIVAAWRTLYGDFVPVLPTAKPGTSPFLQQSRRFWRRLLNRP
jgi:hypothetical protein